MSLGQGKHTAWITDRGGQRRIGQLHNLSLVRWSRLRDDISEATIQINADHMDSQADLLRKIEPGRHELCIYRNRKRVWEGPIGLPTFSRQGVEIHAKDVMYYAVRTAMRAGYSSAYPNVEYVTSRAYRIMMAELARKEALGYNLLDHIVEHHLSTDAKTTAVTMPMQFTVFEHIDAMASDKGMDYTVVGRAIHLWDTSVPAMGRTRTATESDFSSDVIVSVYGSELATSAIVTDGQGNWAEAGGIDPFYGEWEVLHTAYDETEGETPPTEGEMYSQALRNRAGRLPTPLQVRVPDNSTLNPKGMFSVDDLVPGVYIPLLANIGIRKVSQTQKLDSVRFEQTADGETVSVVMSPSTSPDAPEEE